jgi:hypothetical protein
MNPLEEPKLLAFKNRVLEKYFGSEDPKIGKAYNSNETKLSKIIDKAVLAQKQSN